MNSDNNIFDNEDLEDKASDLNRSGSDNTLGPGNDYFENFQNKIMSRVEEYEELNIQAPILSNIPKYNPFDVPVGYFDELPTLIQQKCINRPAKFEWREWLAAIIKPNFAIPVLSVLLIASAAIYYTEKNEKQIEKPVAEEINIDEQLQNIDESTIIDALAETNNESINENDNEKIMNYLLENNVDETNLNNEL
jgi:disulfide oxidoreductase YuzD